MYCPNCAEAAAEDARFCRGCGIDLRPISDATDGSCYKGFEVLAWTKTVVFVLFSVASCFGSAFFARDGVAWRFAVGFYVASLLWFTTAAVAAYLRLHPSVQIGHRETVNDLLRACVVVFAAGGIHVALHLAGRPNLALATIVLALAVVPRIVRSGRTIYRAQLAVLAANDEEHDESDQPESTTGRPIDRRAAWHISPPPSIVAGGGDVLDVPRRDTGEFTGMPRRGAWRECE